jgi:hypothetical protein
MPLRGFAMSERIPRDSSILPISPWLTALWEPPLWLAAWDGAIMGLTGLACRQLNPAGHAGHTSREMLVIAGTAALAACLLHNRGLYDRPRGGRPSGRTTLAVARSVLNAFGLMLLALLVWEGIGGLWQGPDVGGGGRCGRLARLPARERPAGHHHRRRGWCGAARRLLPRR